MGQESTLTLSHTHTGDETAANTQVAAMGGRSQGGSEQRSPYSPQFITALNEFEDRTCAALGMEAASADSKPGAAGGGKKGSGAGSAAAGAGGWVLNRCDGVVVVCLLVCGLCQVRFVLCPRSFFRAVSGGGDRGGGGGGSGGVGGGGCLSCFWLDFCP